MLCERIPLAVRELLFIVISFISVSANSLEFSKGFGYQYSFVGAKATAPFEYLDLYISAGIGISVGVESKKIANTNFTFGVNTYISPLFYSAKTFHLKYHFGEDVNNSWAMAIEHGTSTRVGDTETDPEIESSTTFLSLSRPVMW